MRNLRHIKINQRQIAKNKPPIPNKVFYRTKDTPIPLAKLLSQVPPQIFSKAEYPQLFKQIRQDLHKVLYVGVVGKRQSQQLAMLGWVYYVVVYCEGLG